MINPDLERWYAARAKSHIVEVPDASHSVYMSHPKEVAELTDRAARAVFEVAKTPQGVPTPGRQVKLGG